MNNKRPVTQGNGQRHLAIAGAVVLGLATSAGSAALAQVAVEYGNLAAQAKAAQAAAPKAAVATGAATKSAAAARQAAPAPVAPEPAKPVCAGDLAAPVSVNVVSGKSTLFKLPAPITLRTLGDEDVVQARLLGPQALYLLGVGVGSTNMILQDANGVCTVVDVNGRHGHGGTAGATRPADARREVDHGEFGGGLHRAVRGRVRRGAGGAGRDACECLRAQCAGRRPARRREGRHGGCRGGQGGQSGQMSIGRQNVRVVNLLSVTAPQQVMLEVKVAEVSKTLIDKLGASLNLNRINGDWTYTILMDFLSGGAGVIDAFRKITGEYVTIDAEKKDGLIKILAEPNLMAISGQEGSFLAGGKVYFPVAQGGSIVGGVG